MFRITLYFFAAAMSGCTTMPDSLSVNTAVTDNFRQITSGAPTDTCAIIEGDSLKTVKVFYNLSAAPLPFIKKSVLPNERPGSYYRLDEIGVWIFLDADGLVRTMRYESPFTGSVGGIFIGDQKDHLIRERGKPDREMDGISSIVRSATTVEKEIQIILDSTPEVISKDEMLSRMKQIEEIRRSRIPVRNRAWVYRRGKNFFRYDISPTTNRVEVIFTDSC